MTDLTLLRGPLAGPLAAAFDAIVAQAYPPDSLRHQQQEALNEAYFQEALVVLSGSRPVARCCLYDNPYLQVNGSVPVLFGNFESVPDATAGEALLDAVVARARDQGRAVLLGPMNGSTWDAYRMVDGPQPEPFFSEPIQQPYYSGLFEAQGFRTLHRYVTWHAPITAGPEAMPILPDGVHIRTLSAAGFSADLARLHSLCHRAFEYNPLYSPLTQEAFVQRYEPFAPVLNDGYSAVAEDASGRPLAFLLAFRDRYQPHRVVLKTVAKDPDCAIKGLAIGLTVRALQKAVTDGCTHVLHAFIHDGNARSLARSLDFGGQPFREYRLYAKNLSQA